MDVSNKYTVGLHSAGNATIWETPASLSLIQIYVVWPNKRFSRVHPRVVSQSLHVTWWIAESWRVRIAQHLGAKRGKTKIIVKRKINLTLTHLLLRHAMFDYDVFVLRSVIDISVHTRVMILSRRLNRGVCGGLYATKSWINQCSN